MPNNFITEVIDKDLENGLDRSKLAFRFPPEPNGYLHIGHASAVCLNFWLGQRYDAPVYLRYDDTNPMKEEDHYVAAIKKDIDWLGFDYKERRFTSDYFDQLYKWAIQLIENGDAYIDSQSSEEIAEQKGTPTEDGTPSPYRDRPAGESLKILASMKDGEDGAKKHVLRAKIDMASPNMLMRDPVMYRVVDKAHHRTGTEWKIYPMYDWAHGQSDYIEQVSHSLCSLEFMPHRELYEWFVEKIAETGKTVPKQREFARRNLSHTITSKRKLQQLIEAGKVEGWDDPRMPTISGMRRRGYTADSIKNFVRSVGIGKRENIVDMSKLEHSVRDDLNQKADRLFCVLDPVKLVITNYPEGKTEQLEAENNQEDPSRGHRKVPFTKEIYIERSDFREEANRKFFRLKPGKEVRLKNAYIIKGEGCVKNDDGTITEIHATYDPDSKSGSGTEASKRKVKGTLHWVSCEHAVPTQVRLYDRLFTVEDPTDGDGDFLAHFNPESLQEITAMAEPSISEREVGETVQFQRKGYFCMDADTTDGNPVYNRTVPLRDNWKKRKN